MKTKHKHKYKRRKLRKKQIIRNRIIFFSLVILILGIIPYSIYSHITKKSSSKNTKTITNSETNPETKFQKKEIIFTAAGDFTLGTDDALNKSTSLPAAFKASGNDYSYFLKNVRNVFKDDDYTLVNLETTFTNSNSKIDKGHVIQFNFKGPSSYAKILTSSSVEGVTIANNHIYDYGKKGFDDTINVLQNNKLDITGEGYKIVKDIKGIKFAFLGYQAWDSDEKNKEKIKNDIEILKKEGVQVIIPYFHWGREKDYKPTSYQKTLAHYAIDCGATMVLGSHPHVIQSLEDYKGKLIVYSLGNFCFGGNPNPSDKRTFILKSKLIFNGDSLSNIEFKVLPASISSVSHKNDYVPTLLNGEKEKQVLKFMNSLSPTLHNKISNNYFKLNEESSN